MLYSERLNLGESHDQRLICIGIVNGNVMMDTLTELCTLTSSEDP